MPGPKPTPTTLLGPHSRLHPHSYSHPHTPTLQTAPAWALFWLRGKYKSGRVCPQENVPREQGGPEGMEAVRGRGAALVGKVLLALWVTYHMERCSKRGPQGAPKGCAPRQREKQTRSRASSEHDSARLNEAFAPQ